MKMGMVLKDYGRAASPFVASLDIEFLTFSEAG